MEDPARHYAEALIRATKKEIHLALLDLLKDRYEAEVPNPAALRNMARELVGLPVREMGGNPLKLRDFNPLLRTATDGERNGRLAWTPGA